jgi:crotonobetainyl-CoA:carnitine CoA-transferase CaiB-like acyl-CoA transferase
MRPLDDVRVLELSTGIAGAYCTKLLTDAGADTVKVEPAGGDPLRAEGSGALFGFLNAAKRSVLAGSDRLLAGADVVVTDGPLDTAALWRANPALVVVTITPFGCGGPWVGRPATEFTMQAACGSIGQRGLPEEPPLAAGGRIGEWMAGTYAAVAALAALREAERCGQGEHVDVATFDCMAVTMVTYPSVFASFAGWPKQAGTGRTVEVPSVEPCADGYVVFTTNSAQQFEDFLVLIGRQDWLADEELRAVHRRFSRRREFLEAVHKFTLPRTSDELLEAASLLRIPSGPVLDAPGIRECDHFRARGVLQPAASGAFVQPRPPYRMEGGPDRAVGPVPEVGEHDGAPSWPSRPGRGTGTWRLPLEGLRVIDCTAWWAGPSAPCALGALGADVVKVESTARADGMRFSSVKRPPEDSWWEWSALFHAVNVNKRAVTVDLGVPAGREVFLDLLRSADVLIENYTPRVMENFGLGWEEVRVVNPDLVMVRMPAFGLDGPWRDRTGFAQTMECVSGMAWRTGFPDGPPVLVRGACDPLAGMHAVFATLLALRRRAGDGHGSLVESVMVEAALNAAAEQIVEHSSSGRVLVREGNRGPGAPQGVYRCAGEDRWVAVAVEDDGQWAALVGILGSPPWSEDPGLATAAGRRQAHDDIDARLSSWCAGLDADAVAERLVAAGVPAATVIVPREVAQNPQLRHRALFETEDHPVTGAHEVPTMPFRFGRVAAWLHRVSPTLGQHNDEVLSEAGYSSEHLAALRTAGVVGERLAGY